MSIAQQLMPIKDTVHENIHNIDLNVAKTVCARRHQHTRAQLELNINHIDLTHLDQITLKFENNLGDN